MTTRQVTINQGHVISADGTRIAHERRGAGPPVVIVAGLLCDRTSHESLARALAGQFTALTYDRRGRGDSGDTPPYAVEREIEDLGALIDELGGSASVYGHSSGAGLALEAAAAGLPISRLVLHEPPYGADDEASKREARELAEAVRSAIAEDRPGDAIGLFMAASGMPEEMIDGVRRDPRMLSLAPTMLYDFEVMGEFDGGGIPEDRVRAVTTPTLLLAGSTSPDFFRDTASRVATMLPNARYSVLEGHDHGAPGEAVGPIVARFLLEDRPSALRARGR